ncbi:ATP phosphoribosyltransferase regulatory subunit [Novosphingobium resinovorum]|jgi:ATP phosphoribosyltransferase regulatory subunit|uniref:Histidine--tRNA ligase n=1 Tax=Novosphingobium resinovorum TaxID=158500 RepID=A0A031K7A8_9SPHN|nr:MULTISPECIES: ATP phosphoribosyltransferase regulatory subunit [Sphingomonadaceae]AOR75553.1 ATP phosphoribosyltransferase regulatory subunit [Novosphingobium resinovorum]EJU13337.1 ATP phosphoribosyltransferase [Sphingomonas sp. LH128]EZP84502.1 ATP phosphoribosyltransferase [Novosphingobium resinovorum]MBF7010874.1 ATP phosphoribosyltransferase regulatory subunit [Novosphingobium sp. HR1a]WJM28873.1 ATP phosphoribosyltransferase regulatory subunit [Novosphingobium resinovorum]
MQENDRDLLPEGLGDRLPQQAWASQTVRRAAHDVLASHGYARVETPVLEFEKALAHRMAGVQVRRMFRFVDPVSMRMLALRSDITAQVARIAATGLAQAPRPLRLSYSGQVVTIKGDGLDPARERLQLGAELVGADSTEAVAEIVELAIEALRAAGATGVSVDFTLPDLVDTLSAGALPLPSMNIEAVRQMLDAKDAGGLVDAGGEAYLPLLYAVGPFDSAIEQLAAFDVGGVLASRIAALRAIAARVGGKARLTLDPSERHGFEYQSWFGFTIYADGVPGSLGRGGTYSILGQTGRNPESATGFSLYPDPLIESLSAAAGEERRLFLPLGHDREVASRQRAIGWVTVAALSEADDALALGCSHKLEGGEAVAL